MFQRLSVFAGGFDLKAAENVCAGEGIEREHILDLVTQLVEKSLVLVREQTGTTRYRLLEPIRQYAQDRLRESGALPVVQRRHVYYFLRVAQGAASQLLGPDTLLAVEELELEHANLLAALAWAAENEPESALKLSNALGWFWECRGYLAEGREWFKRTIAQSPATLVDLQGEAHVRAGRLACWQGEYEHAIALTEKGLRLCEQSGNRRWLGVALNNLGGVAAYRGELARAEACLSKVCRPVKNWAMTTFSGGRWGIWGSSRCFKAITSAPAICPTAIANGRQRGHEDGGTIPRWVTLSVPAATPRRPPSTTRKPWRLAGSLDTREHWQAGLRVLGKLRSTGVTIRARAHFTRKDYRSQTRWARSPNSPSRLRSISQS